MLYCQEKLDASPWLLGVKGLIMFNLNPAYINFDTTAAGKMWNEKSKEKIQKLFNA